MYGKALAAGMAVVALGGLAATPALAASTAKSTSLSIKAAKGTTTGKDTISGVLTSDKKELGKEYIRLETRVPGASKFTLINHEDTSSKGAVSFSVDPARGKHEYVLVYAGNSAYKASKSAVVTITEV